jgi:hypothetical protein
MRRSYQQGKGLGCEASMGGEEDGTVLYWETIM